MNNLKIKNSYIVIENKLFAGSNPVVLDKTQTKNNLSELAENNIEVIINLTNKSTFEKLGLINYSDIIKNFYSNINKNIKIERFGIKDFTVPDKNHMLEILKTIDNYISQNKKLYIHCMGGIGRTGTVIGCYLISKNITDNGNALKYISQLRTGLKSESPETQKQKKMIEEWDTNL